MMSTILTIIALLPSYNGISTETYQGLI